MKISTKGRYVLRMLIDLAEHQGDGYIPLKEIAQRQGVSKKYLEQIVPMLNKSDILRTNRGFQGGYRLAKAPDKYTVGDIFLFFGKNRQSVKILRWDGDGFLLYYKRLEGGSFELPTFNPHTGNYEISYQVLSFILNGVSLKSVRLRKRFRI